jgi:hypothetical protein
VLIRAGFDTVEQLDMYEEKELIEHGFKPVHARLIKKALSQALSA